MPASDVLPRDALTGLRLGLSASDSEDLGRLGFRSAHFKLALGEVARAVLAGGGTLAYGGHLKPEGLTMFLVPEVLRTGRERSLLICLAWHVHRRMHIREVQNVRREILGTFGDVVILGPDGEPLRNPAQRPDEGERVTDPDVRRNGLTAMRRYLHDRVDARLLLGGGRGSGTDAPPGVMEEAVMAVEGGRPLYVAGGFGGVTADIAQALGHDDGSWLRLPTDPDAYGPGYRSHYRRLTELAATGAVADNGLTAEENRLLAISHRPADIAALVTLGLGRWAGTRPSQPELGD